MTDSNTAAPHICTTEDLANFSEQLSDFLYKARKEKNIPLEYISFQLSLQSHDIMNSICFNQHEQLNIKQKMQDILTSIDSGSLNTKGH